MISDNINNKNPDVRPICTAIVWSPAPVASSIISFTHVTLDTYKIMKEKKKGQIECTIPCM